MIPTFIIHHKPLADRKVYLDRVLPDTMYITDDKIGPQYFNDSDIWMEKSSDMYGGVIPYRQLAMGDISCANKHYEALGIASQLTVPSLILEDDAIILDGFKQCMWEVIQKKNDSLFDILFIGGAFPHTIAPTISQNGSFIRKGHPNSNTVCSYVVKPDIAAEIAHRLSKGITLPIDFEFNYICRELQLKVCHYLPYVIREGSSAGYYRGSQQR